MYVIISLITILVALIIRIIHNTYNKFVQYQENVKKIYEQSSAIPGPPIKSYFGNANIFWRMSNEGFLKTFMDIYNFANEDGIAKLCLGTKLCIFLFNPEWIRKILEEELNKERHFHKSLKPFFSESIIVCPVSIWESRRKMLSPVFDQEHLNGYFETFTNLSETLVRKLSNETNRGYFNISTYMKPCVADMISETTLDYKIHPKKSKSAEFMEISGKLSELTMHRMFKIWLQPNWSFSMSKYMDFQENIQKSLKSRFKKLIINKDLAKQNTFNSMKHKKNDYDKKSYIDTIIENEKNGNISLSDQRGELLNLSIAGTDTTSLTISNALILLGYLPEFQEKVIQEMKDIFGDLKRMVTIEDLSKMEYLECVIKETMRLFPPLPMISRTINNDIQLGKYKLPAGSSVFVFVYKMHRLENIWGADADEFNPDRFLPKNISEQQNSAYMPFGAGPRDCLGKTYAMMAMKITLCQILRTYEIKSCVNYRNVDLTIQTLLTPLTEHLLAIQPRK